MKFTKFITVAALAVMLLFSVGFTPPVKAEGKVVKTEKQVFLVVVCDHKAEITAAIAAKHIAAKIVVAEREDANAAPQIREFPMLVAERENANLNAHFKPPRFAETKAKDGTVNNLTRTKTPERHTKPNIVMRS